METGEVIGFEVSYNDQLVLNAASKLDVSDLELKKLAFEALLTEISWSIRGDDQERASELEEESWCWLLTQMGLAIANASRLGLGRDREPLETVKSAAAWFMEHRGDMARRAARDREHEAPNIPSSGLCPQP